MLGTLNDSTYLQVGASLRISIIAPRGAEEEEEEGLTTTAAAARAARIPIAARGGFALMVTVNELIPQGGLRKGR